MKKFGDWLNEQLIERDMRPIDLTKRSNGGLDSGTLSNVLNHKRPTPSVETLKLIAKHLPAPLEEVYRAAGILPPKQNVDTVTEAVIAEMDGLNTEEKKDILEYARFKRKQAVERNDFQTTSKGTTKRTAPT